MSSANQIATVTDDDRHRRDNFWGKDESSSDPDNEIPDANDPAEYIAFQELLTFVHPICERNINVDPWNGGALAEGMAWLFEDEHIDGRGDELHHKNKFVELSDPELYLPKQVERNGRYIEYCQNRHRRRYNPETGYINWGESTTTGLPEVGYDIYWQAVHNYLARRDIRVTRIEEYLQHAKRVWHDPQFNSHESLEQLIGYVREQEAP